MQLNPDTLVLPGTLQALWKFMENHPDVGVCTPKVLNRDGTLQRQCRRSAARPWDVLAYFTGLSRLFPQSRLFGGYLMTYCGENEVHEAEAVSGSCMMIRRAVLEQVGYLDEIYFAYQEDADFCFRVRQAGWKIFYYPVAQIIHFGGDGRVTGTALSGHYRLAPVVFSLLSEKPGERLYLSGYLAFLCGDGPQIGSGAAGQLFPARKGRRDTKTMMVC